MPENSQRVSVETHIERLREVLIAALGNRAAVPVGLTERGLAGRILAEDVNAPMPLPAFDNSQMDGFAVRSADLADALDAGQHHLTLPLAGVAPAGSEPVRLPPAAAYAVMTGAPVPEGADVVIPVERTAEGSFDAFEFPTATEEQPQRHRFFGHRAPLLASAELSRQSTSEGNDLVRQEQAPHRTVSFIGLGPEDLSPGRFIRGSGSDVEEGELLVSAGEALTPAHLGVLAACGRTEIPLVEPTKALVVSSGDEVRTPGSQLRTGQLYDADSPLIAATLESFGCQVETARIGTDDPAWFLDTLDTLMTLHTPHLIVTAGGISQGAYEVVRQALEPCGVCFSVVAQQPGGPQGWGLLDAKELLRERRGEQQSWSVAVVALPGNPVSCAVSLETLMRPALAAVGRACPPSRRVRVRTLEPLSSPEGLRQYRRVRFLAPAEAGGESVRATQQQAQDREDSGVGPAPLPVLTVGGPGSHLLGHLARADALLELREEDTGLPAGSVRDALLLTGRHLP